ncbi:MAG: hypothetical protein ACI8UO_003243 [Verrucomicrobiales bacterium]|jgi:hypothetical protein
MKRGICIFLVTLIFGSFARGEETESDAAFLELIRMVLDEATSADVPFRDVIRAVTGKQVLPIDRQQLLDEKIVDAVTGAIRKTIAELNQPGSPTNEEGRINEVSRHFEDALERHLDALPDFTCETPKTAGGKQLSSGYPDLRIVHEPSGRVAYLDPKLMAADSAKSSLRTFYYTPRTTTSKVLDDAHHLLVGIEHDGNTGEWKFTGWKLVDLYDFKVRLKAEFQASNRDLYQDTQILESD